MKLQLDTTNNLLTKIMLDGIKHQTEYASPRDQDIHQAVSKALEASNIHVSDLTSIEVALGPGSFTGIRVGVAYAQALAYALSIPINGQVAGTPLMVEYGQAPSITPVSKSKPQAIQITSNNPNETHHPD